MKIHLFGKAKEFRKNSDDKKALEIVLADTIISGLYFMTDWSIALPKDSEFEKIGEAVYCTKR